LLKDLGLLNTFWALVLPGAANGYAIFLLKGFFDSLPRELYEAAELDGAREFTIFWHITMSLSKPILSIIALGAFLGAYGSFMWAFLVCQKPEMWTLMVWLYQFQIWNPPHLVMAALVLASIPTLTVFVACQRIILRGILIPTLK
jgi:multiple sugar transport system permease protein